MEKFLDKINVFKNQEEYSLMIYEGSDLLYSVKDRGIKPLFDIAYKSDIKLQNVTLLDKIIGDAAARICIDKKVSKVYGAVMSEKAYDRLRSNELEVEYGILVPSIKNRTKSGMCPVEQISLKSENIEELKNKIHEFLESLVKK